MEIHELNTFSGTLGANDYFATDNGEDTSKVSAKTILDQAKAQADADIATAMADVNVFVKGFGYGTCSTSGTSSNSTRYVTLSGYELSKGGIIAVKFTYAVPSGSYLSVNSEASKRIYYKGTTLAAGIIAAGDTAFFMYDGSYYRLLGVDNSASMASDLTALSDRVSANTGTSSRVALDSYTSSDYTFPSDGYLNITCGAAANAQASVSLKDSAGTYVGEIGGLGNSGYPSWMCFVKKGMKARVSGIANSGHIWFMPL